MGEQYLLGLLIGLTVGMLYILTMVAVVCLAGSEDE